MTEDEVQQIPADDREEIATLVQIILRLAISASQSANAGTAILEALAVLTVQQAKSPEAAKRLAQAVAEGFPGMVDELLQELAKVA